MTNAAQHATPSGAELWSRNARLVLWLLVGIGVVAFVLAASGAQAARAWQIYLVNYLFWTGLGVMGAVLAAIWRATNSHWGLELRGVALGTLGFLPAALIAFLPLIAGRAHIFAPWLGHPKPNRAAWLTPGFLLTRDFLSLLALYVFCAAYAYFLLRTAVGARGAHIAAAGRLRARLVRGWRGDTEEAARAARALHWMTPALLIYYALVMSLVAFDLVMPLDQQFTSTLFGGYYFVTVLYAGWALVALLQALWLAREPALSGLITEDARHQLGKLIFGFCMLYGMVFWSQYLVIWYGNLLEEIPYLILRQSTAPWRAVSHAMIFMSLVLPFCILLSRPVKKNPRVLAAVALLILVGLWLERYVLVVPSLWPPAAGHAAESAALLSGSAQAAALSAPSVSGFAPVSLPLGLLELAISAGFAAAFLLCYGAFCRAFPITLGASSAGSHTRSR